MIHETYKIKEDIENWLKQYEITNYDLIKDKKYGYIVNVNTDVNLEFNNLENFKVKFNIIEGDFFCHNNNLKSLIGSPKLVNGDFVCHLNKLKTLKGCPEVINGVFWCYSNYLKNLEYFPNFVKKDCQLLDNSKLKEIQNINNFEKLYLIHKNELNIKLNKKLEKEINIDNNLKNVKIKL